GRQSGRPRDVHEAAAEVSALGRGEARRRAPEGAGEVAEGRDPAEEAEPYIPCFGADKLPRRGRRDPRSSPSAIRAPAELPRRRASGDGGRSHSRKAQTAEARPRHPGGDLPDDRPFAALRVGSRGGTRGSLLSFGPCGLRLLAFSALLRAGE